VPSYELRVPTGTAALLAPRIATLPSAPAVAEKRVVVKKGETLQKIARRAGVSVAELRDWNDLPRTARPKKGTVLVVPGKRRSALRHEALALASPAPRGEIRGVPTPAAAVTSASLVGPYTSVPPTTASRAKEAAPAAVAIPAEGFVDAPSRAILAQDTRGTRVVRHTVKKGDTLFAIASRYGVSVGEIQRQNRIRSPQALRAGQTLVLSLAALN
jgi:membrane-bound lytic murein transglycosylase D